MDVGEAILKRRSIRRFLDKAVPYEVLEGCVNAARLAPSGHNRQVCEYLVVDDGELLPAMFDSLAVWGKMETPDEPPDPLKTPRAYVVILINNALEAELKANRRVTLYDVGFAAASLILHATGQGLGGCPVLMFRKDKLKGLLAIPGGYDIGLVVALGYPRESPVTEVSAGPVKPWVDENGLRHVPKRRLADILHRNRFPL